MSACGNGCTTFVRERSADLAVSVGEHGAGLPELGGLNVGERGVEGAEQGGEAVPGPGAHPELLVVAVTGSTTAPPGAHWAMSEAGWATVAVP